MGIISTCPLCEGETFDYACPGCDGETIATLKDRVTELENQLSILRTGEARAWNELRESYKTIIEMQQEIVTLRKEVQVALDQHEYCDEEIRLTRQEVIAQTRAKEELERYINHLKRD